VIEQGLIRLILGDPVPADPTRAAAQASLSGALAGAAYPGKAPQDRPFPFAVVAKTGAEHARHYQGRAGACASRVRLEFYHLMYAQAEGLADQARVLLDGYRGPLDGGFTCLGAFQEDDSDEWQGPLAGDEQGVVAAQVSLKVWHTEN